MNFLANPVCSWYLESFPGGSHSKESTYNAGDPVQSLSWKEPLEEKWLRTPVFLPGESHGQMSLAGYSPQGRKDSDTTQRLTLFTLYQIRTTLSLHSSMSAHLRSRSWTSESKRRSIMSNSLGPHGLCSLWNSLAQNTGMGSHSPL